MRILKPILFFIVLIISVSCDKNTLYKAYEDIEDGLWPVNKKYTFQFEVQDTTQQYTLYYLVRNAQQYPYYNLYLTREMKGPDGKKMYTRLDEMYLSDQTTGKPRERPGRPVRSQSYLPAQLPLSPEGPILDDHSTIHAAESPTLCHGNWVER